MECYLDNSATTRVCREAMEKVIECMEKDYGNPSSKHIKGVDAEQYIRTAADIIAKTMKCEAKEILFTSGGTESNNTAIIGAVNANKRRGNHLIVSSVEHSSVKEPFNYLEKEGYRVTYLPVNEQGLVSLDALKEALSDDTILVSVMHVNNEIGTIEPVAEIGKIVKAFNPEIVYHVDAIQSYGKLKVIPKEMKADLVSVSGHKIHAPKGSGFLYIKDKTKIKPLILGGGQQKGMRSGTENVPAIAGLGAAVSAIYNKDFDERVKDLYELRNYFVGRINELEGVQVNGASDRVAPHIVSVSFSGVRAEVLLHTLEDKGIYVSSGSACSSNKPGLSNTLVAIGLDKALLDSTIRFSFCYETGKEELDYTIDSLKEILPVLRKYVRKK